MSPDKQLPEPKRVSRSASEHELNVDTIEKIESILTDPTKFGVDSELINSYLDVIVTPKFVQRPNTPYIQTQWGDIEPSYASRAALDLSHVMAAFGAHPRDIPHTDATARIFSPRAKGRSRERYVNDGVIMDTLEKQVKSTEELGLSFTNLARSSASIDRRTEKSKNFFRILSGRSTPVVSPEQRQVNLQRTGNIAQIEYIARVHDVLTTYQLIGSRNNGSMLMHELTAAISDLKTPNLQGTYEAGIDVMLAIKEVEQKEDHPLARAQLGRMLHAVESITDELISYFPDDIILVVPDQFQELDTLLVPKEKPAYEKTNTGEVEMIIESLPEAGIELAQTIESSIDTFNAYWTQKAKSWRETGFSHLMRSLVVEHGVDKVDAVRKLGVIQRLDEAAQSDIDLARDEMSQGLEAQARITARIEEFMDTYKNYADARHMARKFSLFDLQRQLGLITNDWGRLSGSLQKYWPSSNGAEVVERLQDVLFGEPEQEFVERIELINADHESIENESPSVEQEDDESTYEPKNIEEIETVFAAEPTVPTEAIEADAERLSEDPQEIDTLRTIVDQLDEIVLPPEMTQETLIAQLKELGEERADRINWRKFEDLILLHKDFGGKLYRSRLKSAGSESKETSDEKEYGEVYYTLVFDLYGREFAVAESPMTGNATYVVDVENAPGTWLEMLVMNKRDLRELGGKRIIHSSAAPYGEQHRDKVIDYIVSTMEHADA